MAGPLIARPGQGTSPWDAIKLGAELPGPSGMAAAGDPKLAIEALKEVVAGLRAGKQFDPRMLSQLIKQITGVMGRSRGAKNLGQVPDVMASQPLDSALQMAVRGGIPPNAAGQGAQKLLGAGSPGGGLVTSQAGAMTRGSGIGGLRRSFGGGSRPPIDGEVLGEVAGSAGKAATHPGLKAWIAGILGGGAAGYGLSQLGGGEESPAGLPPGAELLMPSHASTRPARPSGARPRRPGMPPLPGVSDGLPEGLGEMFAAPTDEESRMPEQELSGRNPAMGMDTFFPDGQMNSVRDALGFTGNQQMAPRKKNFLQAILGKLREEL